jgi:Voltage gated chloride channel
MSSSLTSIQRTEAQWSIANSLLLATIIRTGLVVISYGCKVPAGIFVPSMAIGATFGRMVGIMVKAMYTFVDTPFRCSCIFANVNWSPQRLPHVWYLQVLPARRAVHNPWHICLLGCSSSPQWCHENHGHSRGYHVRAHRCPYIYPAYYGMSHSTLPSFVSMM